MGPPPTWRGRFASRRWSTGRPGGASSNDSAFYSCRCMATKAWAKPPQTLAGRPAPWPTRLRVWSTWSTCQIHPRGDYDFDIWSTSLCHPLKCSNFVPMFLKSNKHLNRGTRLVDKVNTLLFYTFTRHVGARNWCFMSTKRRLSWNGTEQNSRRLHNSIGTAIVVAHSLELLVEEFQSIFTFWVASLYSRGK
jgi:hypothetical protein